MPEPWESTQRPLPPLSYGCIPAARFVPRLSCVFGRLRTPAPFSRAASVTPARLRNPRIFLQPGTRLGIPPPPPSPSSPPTQRVEDSLLKRHIRTYSGSTNRHSPSAFMAQPPPPRCSRSLDLLHIACHLWARWCRLLLSRFAPLGGWGSTLGVSCVLHVTFPLSR